MSNSRSNSDDLLSAYRDGELTASERDAVVRLLEESADARSELDDYQALSDLLRTLPSEKAPAGLRGAVVRQIERDSLLASGSKSVRWRFRGRPWLIGTLLAGSAAGLVVAFNVARDEAAKVGSHEVAGIPGSQSPPAGPPEVGLARDAGSAVGMRGAGRSSDVSLESRAGGFADPESPKSEHSSIANAFSALTADSPTGPQPGEMLSYTEFDADGRYLVVEATVVDQFRALNQLQVLLVKNSITPQNVVLDELSDGGYPEAGHAALGLLVVADAKQLGDSLSEAQQHSDLFTAIELTGVLNRQTVRAYDAPAGLAATDRSKADLPAEALGEAAGQEPPPPAATDDLRVPAQARASVVDKGFRGGAGRMSDAPTAGPADGRALSEVRDDLPGRAQDPLPSLARSDVATRERQDGGRSEAPGYQVVNVPRALIDRQQPPSEDAVTLRYAKAGIVGLEQKQGTAYFYQLAEKESERLDEISAGDATSDPSVSGERPQVRRKVRALVLLQSGAATALKAQADVLPTAPVEAPRPVGG